MAKLNEADQKHLDETTEKYRTNVSAMGHRELVEELETQALMANYGYRGPLLTMILRESKAELLRRLKGVEQPTADHQDPVDSPTAEPEQKRSTLFG